ncbi:hypothetical protein L3Q82_002659 [Scortum barcoo]|uniref:Uncharacterized protein n=1 Tax=Scortum barcoo TaxID=214431 RepID=A0ACB8VUD4_9TELE|nr:hypothetical protein L3Q82_002659 [Scortum barcoo]
MSCASVNISSGNLASVALPFVSIEQDTLSYVPWSHNAHDDPYGLSSCAQSNIKIRKPTDSTDCDGETDLQGLVSNILDEADSQDSFYSEGNLPTCNPVWSPKTLREELLQYFQSEAKTQSNPTFPPNYVSREALSKAQGPSVDKDVEDFCQQSSGLSINQWLFNLPNGDRDSYTLRPQKLPPGLPVPNTGNTYVSQIQQSKYNSTSASKDRGNSQPMNNFPDLSDVFKSEINNQCFHPYYEDHYIQSTAKPTSNEPYVPQDINQLVSSLQSFMAGEHDSLFRGDFPNVHRQTTGMHHEDSTLDQWKNTSLAMQTQKQLVGEFGAAQMERNGGVRKQTFNCDAFQDPPGFSPQNGEYFQQPKPFSASLNLPNQYQSKMAMQRENTSLPINVSMNQFSQHHVQQGQMQSKIKPQIQKEKKRMHMPGFLGEGFSTRPVANTNMRGGHKKQAFSQNLYFDHMQPQRYDGENSMVSTGNTQQLMQLMYPVNDPRRHSSMPISFI